MRSSKKLKLGMWSISEQSNFRIFFFVVFGVWIYAFIVLTIGIAMQNLVNCDSVDPVPISIIMRNPVNYE